MSSSYRCVVEFNDCACLLSFVRGNWRFSVLFYVHREIAHAARKNGRKKKGDSPGDHQSTKIYEQVKDCDWLRVEKIESEEIRVGSDHIDEHVTHIPPYPAMGSKCVPWRKWWRPSFLNLLADVVP